MISRNVRLIVRNGNTNEDIDVDCPSNATIIDIVESFIDEKIIPKIDSKGNSIAYRVTSKGRDTGPGLSQTLEEAKVQEGDVLLLYPVTKPGDIGKIFFSIPGILTIRRKATAQVHIAKGFLDSVIPTDEFTKEEGIEVELIEATEVMRCKLEENATRQHIKIRSHNREEQTFLNEGIIKWRFELNPLRVGITNLILKVSATKYFKGRGEKHKDVFFFDKEVLIKEMVGVTSHQYRNDSSVEVNQVSEIFRWDAAKKDKVIKLIQNDEVGLALSELANVAQGFDVNIFHAIVVLQAKLNAIRNQHLSGTLDIAEWLKLKASINYAALNLLTSLDNSSIDSPGLIASFEQLFPINS